jgi:hypothetical protein
MTNEFTDKSLPPAIRRATEVYRDRRSRIERKFGRSCADLVLEIASLQREIGRLSDELSSLEDAAEDLRRSAVFELSFAALNAISNLAFSGRSPHLAPPSKPRSILLKRIGSKMKRIASWRQAGGLAKNSSTR